MNDIEVGQVYECIDIHWLKRWPEDSKIVIRIYNGNDVWYVSTDGTKHTSVDIMIKTKFRLCQ